MPPPFLSLRFLKFRNVDRQKTYTKFTLCLPQPSSKAVRLRRSSMERFRAARCFHPWPRPWTRSGTSNILRKKNLSLRVAAARVRRFGGWPGVGLAFPVRAVAFAKSIWDCPRAPSEASSALKAAGRQKATPVRATQRVHCGKFSHIGGFCGLGFQALRSGYSTGTFP